MKYLKYSLISLVLLAFAYALFLYYGSLKKEDIALIKAVPTDSELILKIHDLQSFQEEVLTESSYWNQLKMIEPFLSFAKDWKRWDSLIQSEEGILTSLDNNSAYFVFRSPSEGVHTSLLMLPYPNIDKANSWNLIIEQFANEKLQFSEEYKQQSIEYLPNYKLYFSRLPGILLLSKDIDFVKSSIQQAYQDGGLLENSVFNKLARTEGKKTDVNLYINYAKIPGILDVFFDKVKSPILSQFSQWLELDLKFKKDELLMTGFTAHMDSSMYFLNVLKQEPQEISIPEILPYDVSFLLDIGIEDFENTHQKYLSYLATQGEVENYKNELLKIERKYKVNLKEDFFDWIGSEFALAYNGKTSDDDSYFMVFRSRNIQLAQNKLALMSEKMRSPVKEQFMMLHQDYIIKQLVYPDLMQKLFGDSFSKLKGNYFVILKDYVIFANHASQLVDLLNTFYLKKTLEQNYNYQYFSDNIFESSNLYLYCNIRNSFSLLTSFLNEETNTYLHDNELLFRNFEGLGLQFSYSNNLYFTNLYLKYNPSYQEVKLNSWDFELDARAIGSPHIIKNHRSGKRNVIVFDQENRMYLINHLGQLLWKVDLMDKPISRVHLIDYYDNGKFQYYFNSENYIYLIDLEGKPVAGFPMSLDVSATSPMAVFDYDNKKDYRTILALSDNKIYNYSKEGKKIKGWHKIQTRYIVKEEVKHFLIQKKDYFIVADTSGKVYITNRRGEIRVSVNHEFVRSKHAPFYTNLTNVSKGLFVTTNPDGDLTYIAKNGKTSSTSFGDFSKEHYFIYADINNDNDPDFIYADKGNLIAFDRFKNEIFSYSIDSISKSPQFFTIDRKAYIGVISDSLHQLQIYDQEGRIFDYITFSAEQGFTVSQLENNGKNNIITTSGKMVYNYRLD